MQTRAIPGETAKLRKALPNTYLMITMHPPQIDFENEDSQNIKKFVWEIAEGADFRDLQIAALINKVCDKTDENVRALYQAIDEVNSRNAA